MISGIGMALAPMSARYSAILLTESMFTFLVALACWLWLIKKWKWAGFVWGISILVRPSPLLFVMILPILPLFAVKLRRDAVSLSLMTLVTFIVISPWIIRNAYVFHQFIPVASSGYGNNLLIGSINLNINQPMWDQVNTARLVSKDELSGKNEFDADKVLLQKALKRIRESPLQWLIARSKQYPIFFADLGQYFFSGPGKWKTTVVTVFLAGNLIMLLLSAYGLYLGKDNFVVHLPISLWPIYMTLVHLPMWVEPRYSLPMMPMLAIFASIGISKLFTIIKHKFVSAAITVTTKL